MVTAGPRRRRRQARSAGRSAAGATDGTDGPRGVASQRRPPARRRRERGSAGWIGRMEPVGRSAQSGWSVEVGPVGSWRSRVGPGGSDRRAVGRARMPQMGTDRGTNSRSQSAGRKESRDGAGLGRGGAAAERIGRPVDSPRSSHRAIHPEVELPGESHPENETKGPMSRRETRCP